MVLRRQRRKFQRKETIEFAWAYAPRIAWRFELDVAAPRVNPRMISRSQAEMIPENRGFLTLLDKNPLATFLRFEWKSSCR